MAGDWIKVEHATLNKPEVMRTAEKLGLSVDAAVGLYVRFWVWLDANMSGSCPGSVQNVSKKSLDAMMNCPGFSSMLEEVGWAKFDDSGWAIALSHAERHNGNTAKTRALDAKRKRDERMKSVLDLSDKRPENVRRNSDQRREEKSIKSITPPPVDNSASGQNPIASNQTPKIEARPGESQEDFDRRKRGDIPAGRQISCAAHRLIGVDPGRSQGLGPVPRAKGK